MQRGDMIQNVQVDDPSETDLRHEMLEAFLAIEDQNAHVERRREVQREAQAPNVRASIRIKRRMFHATGVPEPEAAPIRREIATDMVPNPDMSDAQFYHEQAQERERAERKHRTPNLDIGRIEVQRNRITQLGGLAYIRKREPHHERAAEKFLNLYEACFGGQVPSVDAGRVQVDTSIMAHDGAAVEAAYRARELRDIEASIGKRDFNRIVAVVVLGVNCEDDVPKLPSGKPNWRHVEREVAAVLAALDGVAVFWGMVSRRVA